MDPNNAIELKNVSLTYSLETKDDEKRRLLKKGKNRVDNCVLDNINLDVRKGEVLGIIGTNGAGKSTLLSIMARILKPDSGTVELCGKVATILELGMGFHQDLSGRENIILKGELYGFSKKQMLEKTDDIIDYSGIGKYIDNPVRTYSSGMRGRLAFSIMIHIDAEIMLVDEILSTGDAAFSAKASDFFKKILKDGKTVVYVSHSPGSVESMCTRVIWLDKGHIIADGRPKKVCGLYHEAMMGSIDVILDQAKSGLSDAQYRLAISYRDGIGVEKNEDAYRNWLELAAEQGHMKAQVEMADLLIKSDFEQDRELAISYYQSSAARGDSIARSRLSLIVGKSDLRKEREELKHIFKYMAEKGNPEDIYKYATFLLKTSWDNEDRIEAFKWFKKVADEYNHPDAIIQVASMYRDGIGVMRDKKLFLETIKRGSRLGILKAMVMLADIYSSGVLVEEDQEAALELYEECAERGSTSCQYITATMYQEGKGTTINEEKASYWFEMYSKSQLTSFQLSAINLLKTNNVPNSVNVETIYQRLETSRDTKALMELCQEIQRNPCNYNNRAVELLKSIYEKLSMATGKGMLMAYQYYSKIDSIGFDPVRTSEIQYRNIYALNSEQMYRFSIDNIDSSNESLKDLAGRCMVLLASNGFKRAMDYCEKHDFSYQSK